MLETLHGRTPHMNPLTTEDTDLIESVAEPLGFHLPCYGWTSCILHDSWNRRDIRERADTLTNTLALAGLRVNAVQSGAPPYNINYSVSKL